MPSSLVPSPDLFPAPAYLPRVGRHDGRAIEEALAGATLFDPGVRLDAAVIEATYATEDTPLLKRLRESGIRQLIDPQTLRFVGERYLTVSQFERLPYRPPAPITAEAFTAAQAQTLARDVMSFQQRAGASFYLAAGLPFADDGLARWVAHNDALLSASCAANGGSEHDRLPMLALVAPGRHSLAHPEAVMNRLADYPIEGVYVHPLRLDPVKDSIEKLIQYTELLLGLREMGLHVIAARCGAFGLVLGALGVSAFDSGLCQAEACDVAAQNRAPTEREASRQGATAGPGRRTYLEPLKTTMKAADADAILANRTLRHRFACTLGCCRNVGFESLPDRRRQHYLWVRDHEVEELRARPTNSMRVEFILEQLREARENAQLVRRLRRDEGAGAPNFEHIERWMAVIARERDISVAA
jgi:hypothetical protein